MLNKNKFGMNHHVGNEYHYEHTPYKPTHSYRSGLSSIRRERIDDFIAKEAQLYKDNKLIISYCKRIEQKANNVDSFLSKSNLRIREKRGDKATTKTAPLKRNFKHNSDLATDAKKLKKRNGPDSIDKRKVVKNIEKEPKFLKKRSSTIMREDETKCKRYVYSKLPQKVSTQTQYHMGRKDEFTYYDNADIINNNFQYDKSYEKEYICTPNVQNRTGITQMSTNTKGFRSELKNRESPSPFRFTPAYNRITSPPNNYDRENHDMGQREELDPSDSINDREMTPEKEILDDQFRTPNAFSRIKAYNQVENPPFEGGIPKGSMVGTIIPKKMSDIQENINDTEMDDNDCNRAKKIRDYSFSPSKTPSKMGRDEQNEKMFKRWTQQIKGDKNLNDQSNSSINDRDQFRFSKNSGFQCRNERNYKTATPERCDIQTIKMLDQPDYDGIDKNITIWCTCNSDVKSYLCESSRTWINIINHKFHYLNWKQSYQDIIKGNEQSRDICKDIERTFQKHYAFRHISMIHKLSRVLNAISLYDRGLGYVQGMNFLAGALLLHCEESIAFWLMVELFESYELREVYDDGLKGMYRHSAILEKFIQKYLPKIHKHLEEVDVKVEMFMSDWVISFLCSYIPLNRLSFFLTRFFQRGWVAFHCMVLAILEYLQNEILETFDMPGAMGVIKTMKEHRNSFNIKRVGKSRRTKDRKRDTLEENSSEMPELKFKNRNELQSIF